MLRCGAIIPCHNEGPRVAGVVAAVRGCPLVSEVLVVDDGSKDDTTQQALSAGASVLQLRPNRGKAAAMDAGLRRLLTPVVLFLDGDLSGITSEHVRLLVDPVQTGRYEESIGLLTEGRAGVSQQWIPVLSGQRCMTRWFWLRMVSTYPQLLRQRFGVEMGLTVAANRFLGISKVLHVRLHGLGHEHKEQKFGMAEGAIRRVLMYADIFRTTGQLVE